MVLVTTSPIASARTSPSGVRPVVRISFRSLSLCFFSSVGVRLATALPSGPLPPARNRLDFGPPRKLRGVWHSPQCPRAWTRYAPRLTTSDTPGTLVNAPGVKKNHFQKVTVQRQPKKNHRSCSLLGVALGGRVRTYAHRSRASPSVILVNDG